MTLWLDFWTVVDMFMEVTDEDALRGEEYFEDDGEVAVVTIKIPKGIGFSFNHEEFQNEFRMIDFDIDMENTSGSYEIKEDDYGTERAYFVPHSTVVITIKGPERTTSLSFADRDDSNEQLKTSSSNLSI